ncbi:MAG: hypothetical protein PHN80_03435 [Hespellia sp.]|nr:hypothetical protein [Hespellia sp.]
MDEGFDFCVDYDEACEEGTSESFEEFAEVNLEEFDGEILDSREPSELDVMLNELDEVDCFQECEVDSELEKMLDEYEENRDADEGWQKIKTR